MGTTRLPYKRGRQTLLCVASTFSLCSVELGQQSFEIEALNLLCRLISLALLAFELNLEETAFRLKLLLRFFDVQYVAFNLISERWWAFQLLLSLCLVNESMRSHWINVSTSVDLILLYYRFYCYRWTELPHFIDPTGENQPINRSHWAPLRLKRKCWAAMALPHLGSYRFLTVIVGDLWISERIRNHHLIFPYKGCSSSYSGEEQAFIIRRL